VLLGTRFMFGIRVGGRRLSLTFRQKPLGVGLFNYGIFIKSCKMKVREEFDRIVVAPRHGCGHHKIVKIGLDIVRKEYMILGEPKQEPKIIIRSKDGCP
jgi:hypothetical protein